MTNDTQFNGKYDTKATTQAKRLVILLLKTHTLNCEIKKALQEQVVNVTPVKNSGQAPASGSYNAALRIPIYKRFAFPSDQNYYVRSCRYR